MATRVPSAVFSPAMVEHRRPVLPDPCPEDAGRLQRARMLCSVLVTREMAALKAERDAAAKERVRLVGAAETWASAADRGAQGPAMQARGVKVEDVLVDVREEAGTTYLERASVARVRDGVIDHYERAGVLWGRRLDAMVQLADLYQGCRIAPGTGRSGGGRGYGGMSTGQARDWADYCRATDHLSLSVRPVVEDVARGLFPSSLDAAAKLRDGARQLADHFRLTRDKIEERGA
jgi:hypothetical protein